MKRIPPNILAYLKWFVPILLVVVNLSVILVSLYDGKYLWRAKKILLDYFIGLPLILLLVLVVSVVFFSLLLKRSFQLTAQKLFFLILIFFISLNIALLPEIDRGIGKGWEISIKKSSQIEDTIRSNPSLQAEVILRYLDILENLNGKRLFCSRTGAFFNEFYLIFSLNKISFVKKYDDMLSEDQWNLLQNHPQTEYEIRVRDKISRIKKMVILLPDSSEVDYYLYSFDKSLIWLPASMALHRRRIGE